MKTVLITGGSRGIGRAMVELFSENGYNVAFTYKSSEREARELSERLGAFAVKADSSREDDIIKAVSAVNSRFGGVDILINNAGVSSFSLLTDVSLDLWNETFAVSVTGAFLYSKYLLPHMINEKWGRIINISSMWGLTGSSCEVHYSAAKAALIGFTKALAKEVGPSGITVNAIAPGLIRTDMNASLSKEDIEVVEEQTPLGRIGEPREIAEAALFLASEKSAFVTGDVVNISGGFVV